MKRWAPLAITCSVAAAVAIAAIGSAAAATPSEAAKIAASEGLVPIPSRVLDQIYLRPNAELSGYRKVFIDPVEVALIRNWLKNQNATRDVRRWLVPEDAEQIVQQAASSMTSAVAQTFRERGYEIATAPGAGVLRVAASVSDLDVFAPDVASPGRQTYFTKLTAGEATLRLEVRDAGTGKLLGQIIDRDTASQVGLINRTTSISNEFWFNAMFRQWAGNCVAALASNPGQP